MNNFLLNLRYYWPLLVLAGLLTLFLMAEAEIYEDLVKPYLPLITPLFLSVVATVIRASEEGGLGLRGLAIDLSLGVVSFDVWAISTVMTSSTKLAILTQRREENGRVVHTVLDTSDVTFCLVLAFFLIALCSWISKTKVGDEDRPKLRELSTLVLAGFCFFLPAKMATEVRPPEPPPQKSPAPTKYSVSVRFTDASLVEHVGVGNWGNRHLCYILEVDGDSPETAKMVALSSTLSD